MSTFDDAFEYTVGNEGAYSNNPADAGGPTKFGITQADLASWVHHPVSPQEVKELALEVAKEIYARRYWDAMGCGQVQHPGVAIALFDIGVVRGIAVPPVYAQEICNENGTDPTLDVDGHLGPATSFALNALAPALFLRDFSAKAEQGFREIVARRPSQRVFLGGWVKRAHRLLSLVARG